MNTLTLVIGEGTEVHHAGQVVLVNALPAEPTADDWRNALQQPMDGKLSLAEVIKATAFQLAGRLAEEDGVLERTICIELQMESGKYLNLSIEIELTPTDSPGGVVH